MNPTVLLIHKAICDNSPPECLEDGAGNCVRAYEASHLQITSDAFLAVATTIDNAVRLANINPRNSSQRLMDSQLVATAADIRSAAREVLEGTSKWIA